MTDLRISDMPADPAVSDTRMLEVSTGAGGNSYSLTIGALKTWFGAAFALLTGATFTGAVKGVAPAVDDNSATFPTTAWFMGQLASASPAAAGVAASGTATRAARADHVHPTDTSRAKAGANSDLTSLSGLTTPLSAAQGGTGTTTGAVDPALAMIAQQGQAAQIQAQLNIGALTPGQILALAMTN